VKTEPSQQLPRLLAAGLLLGVMSMPFHPAVGAAQKFFAYNSTTRTDFTGVYLAPDGTQNWGSNQALNDKDKSLDSGERLTLTGLAPGRFSVKLVDRAGHTCVLRSVDLTKDSSFEIRDDQLSDCH
jgi:hypothetical protein